MVSCGEPLQRVGARRRARIDAARSLTCSGRDGAGSVRFSWLLTLLRRLHCDRPPPSGERDGEALEMAFSKKRVEERKQWLQGFRPGTFLDHTADTISYSEFVHKVRARVWGGRGPCESQPTACRVACAARGVES